MSETDELTKIIFRTGREIEQDRLAKKNQMSEIDDELLPCPFCGGAGHIWHDESSDYRQHWSWNVGCNACDYDLSLSTETRVEAVAAWNRRESATRIASLTARVSEVRAEALEEAALIAESFFTEVRTPAHFVPPVADDEIGYTAPPQTRTTGPLPKKIAIAIRSLIPKP